jgi:RNA recognition motif-containing protein
MRIVNPYLNDRMNIYVANISFRASESELKDLFARYGEVSSVKILKDRETNRSRGFGFVEMPNEEQARAAIAALNGTEFAQRNLIVKEALPPKK